MKVDEMQAGRELDALVAEKAMGLFQSNGEWYRDNPITGLQDPTYLPDYSTDIAAAWLVVEKINTGMKLLRLRDGEWRCDLFPFISATANTAPLAICRAALKEMNGND